MERRVSPLKIPSPACARASGTSEPRGRMLEHGFEPKSLALITNFPGEPHGCSLNSGGPSARVGRCLVH
jgi:hypothetical protein